MRKSCSGRKGFRSKFLEDWKNLNLRNTSEKAVLASHYFSAYRGKLVIRTNGKRSGSFGILFITRETNLRRGREPENIVRHEYGHTKQLAQLGWFRYLTCIAIPSFFLWGDEPSYYDRPWEVTADIYGGVRARSHSDRKVSEGFCYLENSHRRGIRVWKEIPGKTKKRRRKEA